MAKSGGGTSDWYSALYEKCVAFAPAYWKIISDELCHIGDEFLTTLAVAKMKSEGWSIYNAGALNIIHRYLGELEMKLPQQYRTVFLHIPSDKTWVASLNLNKINSPADFYRIYRYHRYYIQFKKLIKKIIHR